jgi:hypothetical protein
MQSVAVGGARILAAKGLSRPGDFLVAAVVGGDLASQDARRHLADVLQGAAARGQGRQPLVGLRGTIGFGGSLGKLLVDVACLAQGHLRLFE